MGQYGNGCAHSFDMPVFRPEYVWDRDFGKHPEASVFNPVQLNTDQWVLAAKSLGAKYALLVAKHCSGFSLWPTAAHEYSVKNSPWKNGKGDIVKEFIASCKKYGLKPGIYSSTGANGYLQVNNPAVTLVKDAVKRNKKGRMATVQQYQSCISVLKENESFNKKLFIVFPEKRENPINWFDSLSAAQIDQISKPEIFSVKVQRDVKLKQLTVPAKKGFIIVIKPKFEKKSS